MRVLGLQNLSKGLFCPDFKRTRSEEGAKKMGDRYLPITSSFLLAVRIR